jgi:hypothetical protein
VSHRLAVPCLLAWLLASCAAASSGSSTASASSAVTVASAPNGSPPPDCRPSAGVEPLLASRDVLLVGEVHGTAESPGFVAETACAALAGGRSVTVALEISVAEQARLDAFLASPGGATDRAAVLAGDLVVVLTGNPR